MPILSAYTRILACCFLMHSSKCIVSGRRKRAHDAAKTSARFSKSSAFGKRPLREKRNVQSTRPQQTKPSTAGIRGAFALENRRTRRGRRSSNLCLSGVLRGAERPRTAGGQLIVFGPYGIGKNAHCRGCSRNYFF